jgi:hypothetical protein
MSVKRERIKGHRRPALKKWKRLSLGDGGPKIVTRTAYHSQQINNDEMKMAKMFSLFNTLTIKTIMVELLSKEGRALNY